jgi:predicted TIM-barrel fold metal-dependent hydrolase
MLFQFAINWRRKNNLWIHANFSSTRLITVCPRARSWWPTDYGTTIFMRLADEIGCHVYIHSWLNIGGSPRLPGGGNRPGESTPMDVAMLAKRFPNVAIICGHTGGDWELGTRAVRPYENVLMEYSGSDPHSGMIENGINVLGADRLVWGGHGPSRSYATEIGKVLDANISKADRMKIFGGNLRRISATMFRKKGMKIEL